MRFRHLVILGGQLNKSGYGGVKSFSTILVNQARVINPDIRVTNIDSLADLLVFLLKLYVFKSRFHSTPATQTCVIGNLTWALFVPLFPRVSTRSIYLHGFGVGSQNLFQLVRALFVDILTSVVVYLASNINLIANSVITAAHFQGYARSLIKVVPIPPAISFSDVRHSRFPASNDLAQFIYIGRLVPQKNVDLLISAFAQAMNDKQFQNEVKTLLVIGDGPERRRLKQLLNSLPESVKFKVKLLGSLPSATVLELLSQSTHFVSLNTVEPFGITCIEANLLGLHLVCSPYCGALDNIISSEVTTIDNIDTESVAKTFVRAVTDHAKRISAPNAKDHWGRKSVDMFSQIFASSS